MQNHPSTLTKCFESPELKIPFNYKPLNDPILNNNQLIDNPDDYIPLLTTKVTCNSSIENSQDLITKFIPNIIDNIEKIDQNQLEQYFSDENFFISFFKVLFNKQIPFIKQTFDIVEKVSKSFNFCLLFQQYQMFVKVSKN